MSEKVCPRSGLANSSAGFPSNGLLTLRIRKRSPIFCILSLYTILGGCYIIPKMHLEPTACKTRQSSVAAWIALIRCAHLKPLRHQPCNIITRCPGLVRHHLHLNPLSRIQTQDVQGLIGRTPSRHPLLVHLVCWGWAIMAVRMIGGTSNSRMGQVEASLCR